jgi:hypothetical protein
MTWTSRVWFVRNALGAQTREPSSLSQMSRAFRQGVLAPDAEVAVEGEWVWENVRLVLARYASLAPPNAHDLRDGGRDAEGFPELELTLTGQLDPPPSGAVARSEDVTVPAPGPPVPVPAPVPGPLPPPSLPPPPRFPSSPPLPSFDEHENRAVPTVPPAMPRSMPPGNGVESPFDVAIPARLPSFVFLSCAAVAGLVLLVGGGLGIESCSDRLADAVDARTTLIAVLVGLGWLLAGAVVAAAIAVLGRAAAGILLVVRKLDEEKRRR